MGEGIRIGGGGKKEGLYVWKKLTSEGGTFVDYVVDNNESKYPDGGTQDGYWYELFDLKSFGIDFGEVTLASTAESVTVSHNLGTVPSWVALIPKTWDKSARTTLQNLNGDVLIYTNMYVTSSAENTITNETITFDKGTSLSHNGFRAADYYWIAIA